MSENIAGVIAAADAAAIERAQALPLIPPTAQPVPVRIHLARQQDPQWPAVLVIGHCLGTSVYALSPQQIDGLVDALPQLRAAKLGLEVAR